MTPHFLSVTPIFASISPHHRYSHSSQTMSIVHLDCCRSFLTELLDLLLTPLLSLFHIEDKRENINQIMSCLHTTLQFIPIALKGRKSNFLSWTQGHAFSSPCPSLQPHVRFFSVLFIFNVSHTRQAYFWLMVATGLLSQAGSLPGSWLVVI